MALFEYLNDVSTGEITGISADNKRIGLMGEPIADSDATTKGYVDAAIADVVVPGGVKLVAAEAVAQSGDTSIEVTGLSQDANGAYWARLWFSVDDSAGELDIEAWGDATGLEWVVYFGNHVVVDGGVVTGSTGGPSLNLGPDATAVDGCLDIKFDPRIGTASMNPHGTFEGTAGQKFFSGGLSPQVNNDSAFDRIKFIFSREVIGARLCVYFLPTAL